jgi:hypothetical protein
MIYETVICLEHSYSMNEFHLWTVFWGWNEFHLWNEFSATKTDFRGWTDFWTLNIAIVYVFSMHTKFTKCFLFSVICRWNLPSMPSWTVTIYFFLKKRWTDLLFVLKNNFGSAQQKTMYVFSMHWWKITNMKHQSEAPGIRIHDTNTLGVTMSIQ